MGEQDWFKKPENKKEYSEFKLPIVRRSQIAESGISIVECEKEGSDWKNILENQEKSFLEIGGPSLHYGKEEIINFRDYKDRTLCTNVAKQFTEKSGEVVDLQAYIDDIADAANLKYADESFGAVFARNFRIDETTRKRPKPLDGEVDRENSEYIRKVISEARRVLVDDGLVVWLNLETADFKSLLNSGFELLFYQKREYKSGGVRYQGVFQKKKPKNSEY